MDSIKYAEEGVMVDGTQEVAERNRSRLSSYLCAISPPASTTRPSEGGFLELHVRDILDLYAHANTWICRALYRMHSREATYNVTPKRTVRTYYGYAIPASVSASYLQ